MIYESHVKSDALGWNNQKMMDSCDKTWVEPMCEGTNHC